MTPLLSRRFPLRTSLWHAFALNRAGHRINSHGRHTFSSSASTSTLLPDSETPVAGTKFLETFSEEFEIGSRKIKLETGKIARFANGAVLIGVEETKVLSTVASAKGDAARDFLPLSVEYQEKQFAQGVIPNTFMRREGAPKERELLCGRLIDRPIRPLFPAGFYHEVQVTASVLSCDGKQNPDVLAANATSAALMLSDIPWGGPIGVICIGRISGEFIVNPTMDELALSDLNLVYACTRDKTLMIDAQSRGISERDFEHALRIAHPEAIKYIEPQVRLAAKAGKKKKEYKLYMVSEKSLEKIRSLSESPIEAVFTDPSYGKFERGEALDKITQDVKRVLEEECDEESLKFLPKTVDTVRKEVVRKRIIDKGLRVDGRRLDEVRPVFCEAGNLPQLHGSSIFSRGDTQVLCTVTLGAPQDAQRLASLVGPSTKRFMLHYSFPPFCINEVGKRTGLNRREVGHGTLAEKALLAVLPPEDDLKYTIRVNSEVMASDGSTSMATVCGGSMALMDAGIALREHVAGVSVGLVTDIDKSTGKIKDYRIVTDILGLEDHLGDMDFKISGTRSGITAIQLDIKPAGIPLDIICESLEPALKARLQILDHMEREIDSPRTQGERASPRIVTLNYNNESLRRLLGPLGASRKKIEEETGARISVGDGTLTISAKNQAVLEKALEKVDFIIGCEIEVGGTYKGIVQSVKEYGAFVELSGGQLGLLHISELSNEPVSRVSDVVSVGQLLNLKCIGQDVRGNIKLSLKDFSNLNKTVQGLLRHSVEAPVQASVCNIDRQNVDQHSVLGILNRDTTCQNDDTKTSQPSPPFLIRSAEECDEEEKSVGLNKKGEDEDTVTSGLDAQKLKIGTQVMAKVHQIRARGIVLDLGNGIRGMYRFEGNDSTPEFEVGQVLCMKCSTFSSKGIPVMSLVKDDD
ncbi:polyribonucleotide nucleotidyltransferase 2, mitochondrial [Impatiens glandulifera]|uniref:polyribonucleotide nucleotidyltransferase 2, mitochondrial n=1 Tax=Impatiens glandulifera TaxID=253017 RepID=UPI001FB0918F|nr:polyribonucleotide nucleotidyltransferase 2, mitochondrial [Impatiens glandulifera]